MVYYRSTTMVHMYNCDTATKHKDLDLTQSTFCQGMKLSQILELPDSIVKKCLIKVKKNTGFGDF